MKISSALLLLFLLYLGACLPSYQRNPNFSFETKDSTNTFPANWKISDTQDTNYVYVLDSVIKKEGKLSLRIESKEHASLSTYGMAIWHSFLNGKEKKIKAKAKIKLENVAQGSARLLIFTIDQYDKSETWGNTDPEINGTKDWQEYTIEADFPEDSKEMYIGILLSGTGKAWFDDLHLQIDGKDIRGIDSSFFLQPQMTEVILSDSIISWQHPLSVNKKAERAVQYEMCVKLLNSPADSIIAHPAAAAFPGSITASTPRISKKIWMNHKPISKNLYPIVANLYYSGKDTPNMYSTGLYAAPGEIITIEIPENLKGKTNVQIGCHSDNLNTWMAAEEDWRRMPFIVRQDPLNETVTRTANPFGGLIYISCPPNANACAGEMTIHNAVAAPHFILGKTTDKEWLQMLKETGAPWGELESDAIILTISTENLKKIKDPTTQAHTWDNIVNACYDLAQIPTPYFRKQRIVSDIHIGGGSMHSGYPIMATHYPQGGMEAEFSIANPGKLLQPSQGGANWGFFHEMGHNMQNVKDWVFNGTTEVSVNFFSLYIFDHVLGGRNDAHEGISSETTRKLTKSYFTHGAKFEDWTQDPFLGLITFRQIQTDFGWEPFKAVFRRFHEENAQNPTRKYSDQEKIDNFVIYFSQTVQRNLFPFFKTWGIPVSESVKQIVNKYPQWMPYNFPPET